MTGPHAQHLRRWCEARCPVAPLHCSFSDMLPGARRTTKDPFRKCPVFETMSGSGATMQAISATDSKLKLTTLLNQAQREPVMIRENHRDVAVMLSATEYRRLHDGPVAVQRTVIDPKLAA